jgi:hypothetical protein
MPGLKDRLTDAGYGRLVGCVPPARIVGAGAFRFVADSHGGARAGVQVRRGTCPQRSAGASGGELRALSGRRAPYALLARAFRLPVMPDRRSGDRPGRIS